MFQNYSYPHKRICFALAMLYVIGIFHQPILEGLHYLTHLIDATKDEYQVHKLADHSNNHQHQTLNIIHKIVKTGEHRDLPNKKNTAKNKTQITKAIQSQYSKDLLFVLHLNRPLHQKEFFSQYFPDITFPPPKV